MIDAIEKDAGFTSIYVTASDGLKLHGRVYGDDSRERPTVVCLAGLTRNSADFHALALFLSQHPTAPRRVVALDYRGRGESEFDVDWNNYDPRIEAQDALAFITAIGVHEAGFIGTSRGGLVIFALAAMRPALLRAVVLNDIGPVVDARGLIRIRSYVGKLPAPRNFAEAADILKRISDAQFTTTIEEEWLRQAHATWREKDGALIPRYDVNLMRGLALLDLEKPLPDLWPLFMGLRDIPTFVIRGANSDLLSADTVVEMVARHPRCEALTVADQGHAPLLTDAPTMARVATFLDHAEARAPAIA